MKKMFKNSRNGKIAELTQVNEKYGTVDLLLEDGSQTTIQKSTLRRWWKEIPEETTIEEKAEEPMTVQINEPVADTEQESDICEDGTSYADVMKEIQEDAVSKAKEAKKSKRGRKPVKKVAPNMVISDKITGYLESTDLDILDSAKWKRGAITVKKDNKVLFAIFPVSKTGTYTVSMKEDYGISLGVTAPTYNTKMVKFNLPLWAQELDESETLNLVKKLVKGE